jgi:hypothetical protein
MRLNTDLLINTSVYVSYYYPLVFKQLHPSQTCADDRNTYQRRTVIELQSNQCGDLLAWVPYHKKDWHHTLIILSWIMKA